ncbi:uncharacterized protein LOC105168847 isoform X1 [Sesamum indicum]|uniref:Uncharacterized protein LOC105168847 isoform X1 n=2 Tax=Sesamum indicum TaxID=4182 RepID=A0A6I9TUF4_SESIN|nr:uncharacterized protein LOC105168847 isoform X1 [Sesamum indicum]
MFHPRNTPRYRKSLMDCQHSCTSPLPRIWVIETLAHSNRVDTSLLLDLLEKTPEISDEFGNNARESVSLRILESFIVQGGPANPVSSASSKKIRLNPSDRCEDVLRLILTEMPPPHPKRAGPEIMKWDLQPFIEHKRSTLAKSALQQLKDAILTGSYCFLASLKGQSGLPVRNQPEHEAQVDDGDCNGMKQRLEGCRTNDIHLLNRDLADENLVPVNRKRKATSENAGGNSCQDHILSENGCETGILSVKKYKHDRGCSEQHVGGRLTSAGIDTQVADTVCLQDHGGDRCSSRRETHVEGMALDRPPEGDNSKSTSSNGLVGTDEVLPREKQIPHSDTEPNNKSEGEQEQANDKKGATGDKEGICDSKRTTEDVDKVQNTQRNILDVGEVEDISSDSDGKNDDRTAIATNNNASPGRLCAYSHDSLETTNLRDQNLSSDTSKRDKEERCSLGKETIVEVDGRNVPPGDGYIECISSKVLVGHDEVLPQKKHAACSGTEVPNENFEPSPDPDGENAEGDKNGSHGLTTANEDMDKFEQNVLLRNDQNVDEAVEDVNISSDSDGYYDERSNIDTKKRRFLSSQCTYSQDSLATTDWRELNLCMKCNKGGKLLVCSSNSCPLVIHESCFGSDATFDTKGKFYCPFCAYSQAISKYMEVKKKVSLARKDFATFICLGSPKEKKEPSQRSCRLKQDHLEQDDDFPESNELNKGDVVEKVSNCQHRKRLEFEQAGPSEHPGNSPHFGGKAVDSTNRLARTLSKDKQGGETTRQESQSPKVHGRNQRAARAIRKSRGESTSFQASRRPEVNEKQKHANTRSKKEVQCPPETDLPYENKSSPSSHSTDSEEIPEEENEDSSVSKYFIRVRKQEKQCSYPAIPQLRRKRLPWTSAEEETLKKGMRLYCSPYDKIIPWKKILEFGANVFEQSRTTMDLKDKWRNMCKGTPKSK